MGDFHTTQNQPTAFHQAVRRQNHILFASSWNSRQKRRRGKILGNGNFNITHGAFNQQRRKTGAHHRFGFIGRHPEILPTPRAKVRRETSEAFAPTTFPPLKACAKRARHRLLSAHQKPATPKFRRPNHPLPG